jgi:hypothetical protein
MRRFNAALSLWACLAIMQTQLSSGQELDRQNVYSPADSTKPLSVTITKTLYLPPEMYGHWSVTGTRLETNAEWLFNPVVHDIWILDNQGEEVTVSNPVTGASASVSVDQVDGNTATFHRMVVSKANRVFFEMPTITVNGDQMSGTTLNKYQHLKDGRIEKSYYARYQLEARRIGASRLKFRNEDVPKDFIIEEIQAPE